MRSLITTLFVLLIGVPTHVFAQDDCLASLSGQIHSRYTELTDVGGGRSVLPGEVTEVGWRATLERFRREHTRLNIVSMTVGAERIVDCVHYLVDASIITEPITADLSAVDILPIHLGRFRSVEDYREAFKRSERFLGGRIPELIDLALEQTIVAPTTRIVDVVVVSPQQLGFSRVPTVEDFYAEAQQRGLMLLPAEAALALRLQYDQPREEHLSIAMTPLAVASRRSRGWKTYVVYGLYRGYGDDSRWLFTDFASDLDYGVNLNHKFAFALSGSN